MNQKSLAKWLKIVLIGVGVCGLIVYGLVLPEVGRALIDGREELQGYFWPWLVFLWASGVPCYAVLVLGWKIAGNIGADRSFSLANAKLLKGIAALAAGDAAFFFLGNLIFLFLDINHPGVVLFSLIVEFGGVAFAVAAAALSHLVQKAAELQDQSDLTI